MTPDHSRRHFLATGGAGLGALALSRLLGSGRGRADTGEPGPEKPTYPPLPKTPPSPASARAMISLWMQGGPSHLDLFDPKPELARHHLKNYAGDIARDNAGEASAKLFSGPWKF